MTEPVDDEPTAVDIELFMDAIATGREGAAKASLYLNMVAELCTGIAEASRMMETGRHLEARNLLKAVYDTAVAKLGT
jgi:hypothetical protein